MDVHCHILPGVDDGPETLTEALAMARIAAGCGVTDLAATSHFRGESEDMEALEKMYRRFRRLEEVIGKEKIPLRLHLGAEIFCLPQTIQMARDKALPTIGDTNYVLCEFFFDAPYDYMNEILEGIAAAGYQPVIAHPERYGAIQQDPRHVQRWFHKGYVIQVNKGSVLGAFGENAQEAAQWLLEMGFVHLIASDAHSPRRRTTDLGRMKQWLLHRYSQGYARLLLEENPGRLIRGEAMAPTE